MTQPDICADQKAYYSFLKDSGVETVTVETIHWFRYNGFLRTAYLPHVTPLVTMSCAAQARAALSAPFARWETEFGAMQASPWWHVVFRGAYDPARLSGNTRSKLRRGTKRLSAGRIAPEVVERHGMSICRAAAARYGTEAFIPEQDAFLQRIDAARAFPDTIQFFGVHKGSSLISFAEVIIQGGASCMETIWHDPEHLRDYSGYILIDAILDTCINREGHSYVSDGARSLYHNTNIHDFLVQTFGFERISARLHLSYHPVVRAALSLTAPFMPLLPREPGLQILDKLRGMHMQHRIARRPELEEVAV